jgi:hypothetical protein
MRENVLRVQTYSRAAIFVFSLLFVFSGFQAHAVEPCDGEVAEFATGGICPPGIPLAQGSFHATPLSDGNVNTTWPTTPAPLGIETVTLYGQYGNTEWGRTDEAYTHYNDGLTQAGLIKPFRHQRQF